ncbi:imidazolonepropionase [Desulfopila sp. IMCC35008]|uniref:imidazolonepropionase n=1 Tax=Desulfopila sp. IMCC35008 TaxID=2653858 RepID=UPI0013D0F7BB|nr:imidazolonepropionase [Desulfopila sp. IMCC35008]
MSYTLFTNANIYTARDYGSPLSGENQGHISHIPDGALLVHDGSIVAIGNKEEVAQHVPHNISPELVQCGGRCVIPGFVDPHTHMCFGARRESEFTKRLLGTPYLDILKQGGGILSSVRSVAAASEEDLYDMTRRHVSSALKSGTTSLEIKSGYGLDTENELKMLRAISRVADVAPQDVVATFLGAHAIPPAYKENPDAFIELLINEMLPAVWQQGLADQCDIFCEEGVFSIEQGRRLLLAAKRLGMRVKLHADEVHDLGGGGLAAELGALSADHLLAVSDENIQRMAEAGVVANLLPVTAYSLKKPYARARDMIAQGVPVALATDCNPGSSYCESMPFVIGLAVMNMDMSPEEALVGATLNSSYAIGLADRVGSLEVGKQADMLILDGESPAILAYHAGGDSVAEVYKNGKLVARAGQVIYEQERI